MYVFTNIRRRYRLATSSSLIQAPVTTLRLTNFPYQFGRLANGCLQRTISSAQIWPPALGSPAWPFPPLGGRDGLSKKLSQNGCFTSRKIDDRGPFLLRRGEKTMHLGQPMTQPPGKDISDHGHQIASS